MTPDEITRMAREAGWSYMEAGIHSKMLERFAALVAAAELKSLSDELTVAYMDGHAKGTAAERNKLAAWMIKRGYSTGHGDTLEQLLEELEWQIRELERRLARKEIK